MELYIQVIDGNPINHPIVGDNFREAFPNVDVDNLPPTFARFTRIPPPQLKPNEIYVGVTYERDEIGFRDVHHVRPMTPEEIAMRQEFINQMQS